MAVGQELSVVLRGLLGQFCSRGAQAPYSPIVDRMRWVALLAVVTVIAPASADAATSVRLPSCGSTWYGGKVAPKTWERGCTGTADLTSMAWEDWGAPPR